MVGLTVCSMKYLPVRGFVIFILTSHSCDPKREINFKRRKKKNHSKLCSPVKRGILTIK